MDRIRGSWSRLKFFWLAVVFLWIKSYILYKFGFRIETTSALQEVILFINPLSSVIILLGISLFMNAKWRDVFVVLFSLFGTLILYFNLLYSRFFADFLTLPVLFQTSNAKDLSSSITELMHVYDILLFVDILVLAFLVTKRTFKVQPYLRFERSTILALAVALFFVNLTIAQAERPQLLTRSFDRELLVKNIGMFNYHVYDAYIQSKSKAQRVFADSTEITTIKNYTRLNYKKPDEELFSIAEGKNVIVISLESLQSFVINNDLYGEEITPFLNELINDSYYFDNFYHQTAQGKTSDSEFLVSNSMYGRDSGAVFFTHSGNEFRGLPEILDENGYYTSVMHANNKSFWNRDVMYEALGYEHFYDLMYYDVHEENSIGWGLKDFDFFEQSIELLKTQPEPYYTKLITLTNHFPFELGEEDKYIDEFDSNSGTLNRYFPTVRYMDAAVEHFFTRLKEEGLYENSIFILYGDHYGISENHNRAMSMYLEKDEITPFDTIELQKVPLYIHIPGHKNNEIKHTVSGQIDIKPTILHLLGIHTRQEIQFGSDLFAPSRESIVVRRDGAFITDDVVFTKGDCYSKQTREITDIEKCEPYFSRAENDLYYSDKLLYGDLLRFID
ncbi:LTA synthase family protein [Alkalihalobacillus sp. LMS39]|uniref:LTA synthase family protein n=1 Tax=Alkalihalobacillus sp. LMS39 TaxID=2924032 RepID=UPI001FB20A58|nr:LTA synthase family protein [Alkalihalobacillus sp. LMS39]UOE92514.1 LTA synthase family protein [Alkalihalobacillus sp. LMS39]